MSEVFYPPPTPVSRTEYTIKVQDLEGILRPPEAPFLGEKPYPAKIITMREGSKMLVRQARLDEVPTVLKAVRQYFDVNKDFYDLVSVRTYSEILAWQQHRIKDSYLLLGIVGDELVGLVNARLWNEKIAISLHTMSFKRGVDVGPALYFSKVEYAFDHLGVEEWWATFESYIGLRVMAIEWAKQQKPWPEYQHELGGARVFYLTRDHWINFIKKKYAQYLGERPVSLDILRRGETIKPPSEVAV